MDGTNDNVCKIYAGDCMQRADVFPGISNASCPINSQDGKNWIVGKPKNWKTGDLFQCTAAPKWATVPDSGATGNLSDMCTYTQS